MEEQLATSSCFVGSFDRFLSITENQNRPTAVTSSVPVGSFSEKLSVKRRAPKEARRRLSQITQESADKIEQRLHRRDQSVRRIQYHWKNYYHRLRSRKQLLLRSQTCLHYCILTHLLKKKYAKKCSSVQCLQKWWRREITQRNIKQLFLATQQGR
jgi:hypothetical protein